VELLAAVDAPPEPLSGPAPQTHSGTGVSRVWARRGGASGGDRGRAPVQAAKAAALWRAAPERCENTARTGGARRRPDPAGQPGYLRVAPLLPGDPHGGQGVSPLHAVAEVTPWPGRGGTGQQIGEAWRRPVLQTMREQFPFPIRGFPCDHGREFLHRRVAQRLHQGLIEQTKSRPSHDQGWGETKNGALLRQHRGYGQSAAPAGEGRSQGTLLSRAPQPAGGTFIGPARQPHVKSRKRQASPALPALADAVGDAAQAGEPATASAARRQAGRLATASAAPERDGSRPSEPGGPAAAVCRLPTEGLQRGK
jgi:hypothetical protein